MNSRKVDRGIEATVLTDQYGYDKNTNLYYIHISTFEMADYKERLAYITAKSIDVEKLTITDYTIQFLDTFTNAVVIQEYDSELFEEIYNEAFDHLYKMMEEERLAN